MQSFPDSQKGDFYTIHLNAPFKKKNSETQTANPQSPSPPLTTLSACFIHLLIATYYHSGVHLFPPLFLDHISY